MGKTKEVNKELLEKLLDNGNISLTIMNDLHGDSFSDFVTECYRVENTDEVYVEIQVPISFIPDEDIHPLTIGTVLFSLDVYKKGEDIIFMINLHDEG